MLIKFSQSHDVFICYFIDIMRVYQLDFYHLYNDLYIKFNNPTFETNELNVFETLIVDESTLRCF
jgi:hypothetical protein